MKNISFLLIPILSFFGSSNYIANKITNGIDKQNNNICIDELSPNLVITGDSCSDAIPINIGDCGTYDNTGASTNVSNVSFQTLGVVCPPNSNEIWFEFVTSDPAQDLTITVTGLPCGLTEPRITVFRGDCNLNEVLWCEDAEPGSNSVSISFNGFFLFPNYPHFF